MSSRGDYSLHLRFGVRGASRQGLRPDFRCGADGSWPNTPEARVACETFATTDRVIVGGEVRGPEGGASGRIRRSCAHCVRDIGYAQKGFNWETLRIHNYIHGQSEHIAQGSTGPTARKQAPATRESCSATRSTRPPNSCRRRSTMSTRCCAGCRRYARAGGAAPGRTPRHSSRCATPTGEPVEGMPGALHEASRPGHGLRRRAGDGRAAYPGGPPEGWLTANTVWHVNPTGKFVIGGPDGDAGLTGRKIIVESYGGAAPHGGGAFSGKDPTKVDRSAAYAARYLAKNVVAAGLARRCALQLSYAIRVARPLSIYVGTYGTGEVSETEIERGVWEVHGPRRRPARSPPPTPRRCRACRHRSTAASPRRWRSRAASAQRLASPAATTFLAR